MRKPGAVVALACGLALAGLAGSSVLRQSRARLIQVYGELTAVLAEKHLEGCDVDSFREELLRVEAVSRSSGGRAAGALLEGLLARARALEPAADSARPARGAPEPRPFVPSGVPEEDRVLIDFYSLDDDDFDVATTLYVAERAPGASNRNDGRSPTFEGGTHGPLADLGAERVRAALRGATDGVRVVVGEGTYRLDSTLVLDGRGDARHPTILSGVPGERVVVVPAAGLGTNEPILVAGQHGIVENLWIKRIGNKYNLLVVGSASIVRHNLIEGPWMEDAIKIGDDAVHCLVFNNEITDHGSQAVDSFGNEILIKENLVHHAAAKGMGFGTKGGTRNHVYLRNELHDLSRGLGGGGTGDLELYRRGERGELLHAASGVNVLQNTIYNIDGIVTAFYSCKDCTFDANRVFDSRAGYEVGINSDHFQGPHGHLARGLPSSEGIRITNNAFANLDSGFVGVVEDHAKRGFVSGHNVYYTDEELRFARRGEGLAKLTHEQFREAFGTDGTSRFRPLSEFER